MGRRLLACLRGPPLPAPPAAPPAALPSVLLALLCLSLRPDLVSSECPNACSGHGFCGNYDTCLCYTEWQGSDCSERVCPSGVAWTTTPKGDLNMDGDRYDNMNKLVVKENGGDANLGSILENDNVITFYGDSPAGEFKAGDGIRIGDEIFYVTGVPSARTVSLDHDRSTGHPTGTNIYRHLESIQMPKGDWEMWPGDGVREHDEGHYFMECSNQGKCDRNTGRCLCYPGFTGNACWRMECPNQCSGRGTCETVDDLRLLDPPQITAFTVQTTAGSTTLSPSHDPTSTVAAGDVMLLGPKRTRATVHEAAATSITLTEAAPDSLPFGTLAWHVPKYELWDNYKAMACKCDPGFTGHSCSERACRRTDDVLTGTTTPTDANVDGGSTYDQRNERQTIYMDTMRGQVGGSFRLTFTDSFGQQWHTKRIAVNQRLSGRAFVAGTPNYEVVTFSPQLPYGELAAGDFLMIGDERKEVLTVYPFTEDTDSVFARPLNRGGVVDSVLLRSDLQAQSRNVPAFRAGPEVGVREALVDLPLAAVADVRTSTLMDGTLVGYASGGVATTGHSLSTATDALLDAVNAGGTSPTDLTPTNSLALVATQVVAARGSGNSVGSGATLTLQVGGALSSTANALVDAITTNPTDATNGAHTIAASSITAAAGGGGAPGAGTGGELTLTVSGNTVTAIAVTAAGSGYYVGNTLTIANAAIPGTSTDCVITLTSADFGATAIAAITVTAAGDGYNVGNTLTVASGLHGGSADLVLTLTADDLVGDLITTLSGIRGDMDPLMRTPARYTVAIASLGTATLAIAHSANTAITTITFGAAPTSAAGGMASPDTLFAPDDILFVSCTSCQDANPATITVTPGTCVVTAVTATVISCRYDTGGSETVGTTSATVVTGTLNLAKAAGPQFASPEAEGGIAPYDLLRVTGAGGVDEFLQVRHVDDSENHLHLDRVITTSRVKNNLAGGSAGLAAGTYGAIWRAGGYTVKTEFHKNGGNLQEMDCDESELYSMFIREFTGTVTRAAPSWVAVALHGQGDVTATTDFPYPGTSSTYATGHKGDSAHLKLLAGMRVSIGGQVRTVVTDISGTGSAAGFYVDRPFEWNDASAQEDEDLVAYVFYRFPVEQILDESTYAALHMSESYTLNAAVGTPAIVYAGSGPYTITAGSALTPSWDTVFAVGDQIHLTGSATAANNKLLTVEAISTTVITVTEALTAATETLAGVRLTKYDSMTQLGLLGKSPPLHKNYRSQWCYVTDQRPLRWTNPDVSGQDNSVVQYTQAPALIPNRAVHHGGGATLRVLLHRPQALTISNAAKTFTFAVAPTPSLTDLFNTETTVTISGLKYGHTESGAHSDNNNAVCTITAVSTTVITCGTVRVTGVDATMGRWWWWRRRLFVCVCVFALFWLLDVVFRLF